MNGIFAGWFDGGTLAALDRSVAYTNARHRTLLSNIANADTPGYRRRDVDQTEFRRALDRAYDRDARDVRGAFDGLVEGNRRLERGPFGPFRFSAAGRGPLRHDGNDVAVEREMALLARNAGEYSAYSALLRKGLRQLRAAITEQPGQG